MKLSVNFDSLWQNVRLMGANKVDLDIGDVWRQELDPLDAELAQGREVNIHDLETDSGILSFEGTSGRSLYTRSWKRRTSGSGRWREWKKVSYCPMPNTRQYEAKKPF